jgi:hypothetical protein
MELENLPCLLCEKITMDDCCGIDARRLSSSQVNVKRPADCPKEREEKEDGHK